MTIILGVVLAFINAGVGFFLVYGPLGEKYGWLHIIPLFFVVLSVFGSAPEWDYTSNERLERRGIVPYFKYSPGDFVKTFSLTSVVIGGVFFIYAMVTTAL
jgi:hypothetical protein